MNPAARGKGIRNLARGLPLHRRSGRVDASVFLAFSGEFAVTSS